MRLGELLVAQGLIDAAQLEHALEAQVLSGGRLGSNLVELGVIRDLDVLAHSLGRQLNVPPALARHFDAVDATVLGLVPARLAARHHAVPLGLTRGSPQRLAVAFIDPLQLQAVDEIAAIARVGVVASVAPELRMLYQLERHYGIPRAQRFLRFEDDSVALEGESHERRRFVTPNPPAPAPAPAVAASAPARRALKVTLPPPRPVPPSPELATVAPVRPALSVAAALAHIERAGDRDTVAELVVDHLRDRFGVGVLCLVRQGMALGWKGFAPGADDATIEALALPLDQPSLLSRVHERAARYRGAPPAEGALLDELYWMLLKTSAPRDVVVVPLTVQGKVIHLAYAHALDGGALADGAVDDLLRVCAAAETALARLLLAARTPP